MIPMIVKKPFRPTGSGSPLQVAGATYNAPDKRQAALFRALGWAEDAPPVVPVAAAILPRAYTYSHRSFPVAEETQDKPKRVYRRRDLKAED